MDARATLDHLLQEMSDERLQQLIDFVPISRERGRPPRVARVWALSLSRAFGPDDPDYTVADIKAETEMNAGDVVLISLSSLVVRNSP